MTHNLVQSRSLDQIIQTIVQLFLYEAVLFGHSFGGECETDGNGGEESFGNICDDDTDKEDDGFKPVIAEDKGQHEEDNAEDNCNAGDDVDEVFNFLGDGRVTGRYVGSECGDATHDSVVTASDNDATCGTFDTVGREKSQIFGFKNVGSRVGRVTCLNS